MSYIQQLNRPEADFTMIPRRLCQIGLSVEAIGFMVCIASIRSEFISKQGITEATGLKRDRRQRIQRELQAAGLIQIVMHQTTRGTWAKTYVFDWDILTSKKPIQRQNKEEPQKTVPLIDTEDGFSGLGQQKQPSGTAKAGHKILEESGEPAPLQGVAGSPRDLEPLKMDQDRRERRELEGLNILQEAGMQLNAHQLKRLEELRKKNAPDGA